eukprot:10389560-Karenia_brevis.AAC.1
MPQVSDLLQCSQAACEEVSDMKEASFNSQGLEQNFVDFNSQGPTHTSNSWQTVHRKSRLQRTTACGEGVAVHNKFEALSDTDEANDVTGFSAAIPACESGEVLSLDHDPDGNCEEMTLESQELAN